MMLVVSHQKHTKVKKFVLHSKYGKPIKNNEGLPISDFGTLIARVECISPCDIIQKYLGI